MNINLNDFIPALCEPSLKKIYKDFPGWQKKSLNTEHVHIVNFYGDPVTITRNPRIDTNYFDGFGVIRSRVDGDGDYPFLAPDPVGFMSNVCTADIGKAKQKYSKYIDIILRK